MYFNNIIYNIIIRLFWNNNGIEKTHKKVNLHMKNEDVFWNTPQCDGIDCSNISLLENLH